MALTDPRWDDLTDEDWTAFALAWSAELSGGESKPLPKLPVLFEDDPPKTAGDFVVPMNFTASPAAQWKFIQAAYRHGNDTTLGHLAAGPVEHLLGTHGDDYIGIVEQLASDDPLFAQMLNGCYQNRMPDSVWERLCDARKNGG